MDTEPGQGSGDDTGTNNMHAKCHRPSKDSRQYELSGHSPAPWGHRQRWSSSCPIGSAVCGIKTKVERPQGNGDDTALNDIRMYCCKY